MPVAPLETYITQIFAAAGCDGGEAGRIAQWLIGANLTGHDSHGVIRVPRYVQWLGEGKVNAGQHASIVMESATHAVVDGNRGFGQTVAPEAVDLGIAKAKAAGLSVIALRNAGHIGRIGAWAERAAEQGLVSIHMVNVGLGEIVAPFGGTERRFGTNPLCIGVPQPDGLLLLDFATSIVAEGKVLVASNGGKPIPADALVTADGKLSGDPADFYGPLESGQRDPGNGTGALRAFGDHKGSGIAFMCEILAGCFAGSPTAGPLPEGKRGGIVNGNAVDLPGPPAISAPRTSRRRPRSLPNTCARPTPSDAALPGPGARRHRGAEPRPAAARRPYPLQEATWAAIRKTGDALGVPPPNHSSVP